MPTFNGLIGITSTALTNAASLWMPVGAAVPAKWFSTGAFGIIVPSAGTSGTFGVQVYGSIAGASFPIAGRTGLGAVGGGSGSYPVPLYVYGISGNPSVTGFPRPSGVLFQPTGASWPIAFTASVTLAGSYG